MTDGDEIKVREWCDMRVKELEARMIVKFCALDEALKLKERSHISIVSATIMITGSLVAGSSIGALIVALLKH